MSVLVTFTGYHDPYSLGVIGDELQAGPVISLAQAMDFDRVILISTPNMCKSSIETESVLKSLKPETEVIVVEIALTDPTDYSAIMREIRLKVMPLLKEYGERINLSVAVTSGTPQMHAVWLLMVVSGEIPARLLNVRPSRFVTVESPLVSEIDFTSSEFPEIRRVNIPKFETADSEKDLGKIIQSLGIVGDHPVFKRAVEIAAILASSDVPILILGETGTGKELLARLVHLASGRPETKFVAVNCAAIPQELVESTLFGHRKGAFTGAISNQVGKFLQADGGSLFLDELGELPFDSQAKLLRALQEGEIEPIGASKAHKVNVRIIGATNIDMAQAVREGKFREDLYYRMNVGEIYLPALRERRADIAQVALALLDGINARLKYPKRLTSEALLRLQLYDWPGNIREMSNVIERSARLTNSAVIDADDLILSNPVGNVDPLNMLPEPEEGFSLEKFLKSARKQLVMRALELSNGNQSNAARLLGVTPQAVHKFLQKVKG